MDSQAPPPHGNRQLHTYVCVFITFAAATVALVLRFIARRLTKISLWLDDYFAITSFLCAAACAGLILWWLHIGLGLFLSEIDMPDAKVLERSLLMLWNLELFYAFSLAFAKLAILAFYWRMFKHSNIRLPTKILAACTVIWLIIRIFLTIFHCVPIARFWNHMLPGRCAIDDSTFFFGTVLTHFLIDVAILVLPVIEVQKLQLPLSQRLGITAMFTFGVFVCVASVIVLVLSLHYDTGDVEMPWNISPIIIWAEAEINLAIVSACLPMLRPIFFVLLRRPLTPIFHPASYAHSHPHHLPISTHYNYTLTALPAYAVADLDKDTSESTHQLATREGSIRSSASEYERTAAHGNMTVIMSGADERYLEEGRWLARGKSARDRDRDRRRASVAGSVRAGRGGAGVAVREESWSGMRGIVVTSETTVRVDRVVECV